MSCSYVLYVCVYVYNYSNNQELKGEEWGTRECRKCHREQKEVGNDVNIIEIHENLKWHLILKENNITSIRSLFSS